MLLHAAESELMRHEVSVLVVTSGNQRSTAHAFYERNGYLWTGRRYAKPVQSFRWSEAPRVQAKFAASSMLPTPV
jgi:hypothetical protein